MENFSSIDKKLIENWLEEEKNAHIQGWDFSHLHRRYEEENDLPWDYKNIIKQYLKPEYKLLDIDTGGGEFLLTLEHPFKNTTVTENYPPNIEFCKKNLVPLGINLYETDGDSLLPFKDNEFDIIINKHGNFNISELFRILKTGGIFITQQVGAENDKELIELLLPKTKLSFPDLYLKNISKKFRETGFKILQEQEAFCPIKFYDTGALVWYAHIIEWEFPNFSVNNCLENLFKAQGILEKQGVVEGKIHRFLIVAQK